MLLSFMVNLAASSSVPILGSLGRPAGAWFLRQVTSLDPALGDRLHQSDALRPYSASTLLDDHGKPIPAGSWLHPGQEAWLRFTAIGEEMSEFCHARLFPKLPGNLNLYKMPFHVLGWTCDVAQHPWAGRSTFAELGQENGKENTHQVAFEFASPTAFRIKEADLPLPLPSSVFNSLYKKWNALAPRELMIDPLWPDFAAACIVVSGLNGLNTQRWKIAEGTRGVVTGFTGVVRFSLLPPHFRPKMAAYREGADWVMQTLANFAFYSGVGQHTSIGFGQARRLSLPARSG
jgi:CRISPR-associated endoribonuclease Cas6